MKLSDFSPFLTQTGTPANVGWFADDVYGDGAIAGAVEDLLAGEKVALIACNHPSDKDNPGLVTANIRLQMADVDGVMCPRYLGEGDDPNGNGSHSLIASWYGAQCSDPARVAAAIALQLRGKCVFRVAI